MIHRNESARKIKKNSDWRIRGVTGERREEIKKEKGMSSYSHSGMHGGGFGGGFGGMNHFNRPMNWNALGKVSKRMLVCECLCGGAARG
jgi:hypothetical protein